MNLTPGVLINTLSLTFNVETSLRSVMVLAELKDPGSEPVL